VVQWTVWDRITIASLRSGIGIFLGSAILGKEAFIDSEPNVYLLLTGLACLAGTFALLADEVRGKK
jgi:hypothetical protein